MINENTQTLYVKVKDPAGNDFVCPLTELKDPRALNENEGDNCVEDAVVGRYAGQMTIVDPVS